MTFQRHVFTPQLLSRVRKPFGNDADTLYVELAHYCVQKSRLKLLLSIESCKNNEIICVVDDHFGFYNVEGEKINEPALLENDIMKK